MLLPHSVQFLPDGGLVIEFNELPGDHRQNGVALSRAVMVPGDLVAVADSMAELRELAQQTLASALREFSSSPAVDPEEVADMVPERDGDVLRALIEDEEIGYDNPEEREHVRE